MLTSLKRLTLKDGRSVTCTSPAEAGMLWDEMSTQGYYRRAAAQLHPDDIVLDIGANIGLSAIAFADTCPGVRVIAVEPAPLTFECLRRNMVAHVPDGIALEIGVGAAKGTAQFTWYPRASANYSLYADRQCDHQSTTNFLQNCGLDQKAIALVTNDLHDGEHIDVEVTTVSALLAEQAPAGEIGLVKIDVERAELDVVRGIAESDWARMRTVVAEVHDCGDRLAQFCALLRSHGLATEVRQDAFLRGTALYEVFAFRPPTW
ncbi:FkbM family methyltransferase [Nocardia sp. NPDC005825]|uniref:FkbM family methyltransferase n=1 Tax=unclassified Nocardia TaxID=2637762 RepID=UPI0033F7E35F